MNVRIADICSIKSGKRLPKGTDFADVVTPYPYIRARDIKNGRVNVSDLVYLSEDVQKRIKQYIVETNDVVITIVGASVGDVALVEEKCNGFNLTENAVRLTNFIKTVNPKYVSYLLNSKKYWELMQQIAGGSAQPKLGIYKIGSIEIDLPTIELQNKIVSILSAYDDLIENNQKQIKLLEEAAQRLYKEWFVDLRFPNYENTPVVDGVPEGWKIEKIGNFVSTTSGGTPSRTHKEYYESGTNLWVKTQELKDSYIIDTDEKITDEAIKKSSAKIIPNGSLLLAMYGATIGKLGIANCDLTCNQACCVFLFENDIWKREYLYCWLIENRVFLVSQGKGAAQPNLSQALIKAIDILIPNENLVKRFSKIASVVFQKKCNLEIQIKSLNEARDRLLPKLMSGELEV